jgi:cysteine desulfurase / selenocysteine lyase
MTTPTPTGNGHREASNGSQAGEHSDGIYRANGRAGHDRHFSKLAPWIPDEGMLTRLASDVLAGLTSESVRGLDTGNAATQADPAGDSPIPVEPLRGPSHLGRPSYYFIDEQSSPGADWLGAGLDALAHPQAPEFNVEAVRADFPILSERVNGRQLVWLDNAATTQKPQSVIDRMAYFYSHENSNVHRGAHALAARSTDAYEDARRKVAGFIDATSADDIVFTRGTTESINLVANAWGRTHIGLGDEIVLSQLEHHANIVPWQLLADYTGARIRVIPTDDSGQLMLDRYAALLNERTRLVAIAHVSNVLGTIVPVDQIVTAAHQVGAKVLVDGAQAVAHMPVSVRQLDADFYTFSGHKVFGPTGAGALYAKPEITVDMPPWQGGGNMITDVTFERTRYQNSPAKFEAGTGSIADAVGLGAAIDYVTNLGLANMCRYEQHLLEYATTQISAVPGLRLIGTARDKACVLTFVIDGLGSADVGAALDRKGIAVRAGHHCAQPILRRHGLESAVRPSLAMYNTCAEVDQLVAALYKIAADRL